MPTAVVTGCNSGIGHCMAKVLLNEGYKVIAVDKENGEKLKALSKAETHQLDVTSPESIQKFKHSLGDQPVDLLFHIAGVFGHREKDSLESVSLDVLEKTFAVNTYGPLLLSQALLANVLMSSSPKICIISSRVGSIADNSSGGSYAYRASKAAVNSVGKSMAMDLKEKNVAVLLLHPGYVRTNLVQGMKLPPETVEPEEAAEKLWRNVVSKKGLESTGTFWHREGFELPW